MYDMHYDLLTILYTYLTKENKNYNKEKLIKIISDIYSSNNIKGGIINLYFTPLEEMLAELDIKDYECLNIKEMLEQSLLYLKQMQQEKIIPEDLDYIVGIESCDYIFPEDIKYFYDNYNLRSIIPVWNHANQYGSGNNTEQGLTKLGEDLINEAIKTGIIIDVSHANPNTFYDILDVYNNNVTNNKYLIASHSNARSLIDTKRNLTDEQLTKLNLSNGYIGLLSNCGFIVRDYKDKSYDYRMDKYIEHIDYLLNAIKFNPDRIFLSTDNMNFDPDPIYHNKEAFTNEMIPIFREKLIKKYGQELTDNIMTENAKKLIRRVK